MAYSVFILKLTRLTILAFTMILIAAVSYGVMVLEQRHKEISQQNIKSIKREHIADIVNNAYQTVSYTLNSIRIEDSQRIIGHTETLALLLQDRSDAEACQLLEDYGKNYVRLTLVLQQDDNILCQQQSAWLANLARDENSSPSISREVVINDTTRLSIIYTGEAIDAIVKATVFNLFDSYSFANKDVYLWINQIENFAGGENYATRVYHQNLPEWVGLKLSTELTDINGNKPYQDELDGINEQKEAFIEYYFKRRTSDDFHLKNSYAKLFEPYNWVIASGIYVDDMEEIVAIETTSIRTKFLAILLMLFALIGILTVAVILLINRLLKVKPGATS